MKINRKVVEITLFALAILLMVLVRVIAGSYIEYREGERFYSKGDFSSASIHFDRAIHWYTPKNLFVKKSIDRLMDIGLYNEKGGKLEEAVNTYEILRSAIYSTRSFYTPYKEVIRKTDEKIAALRGSLIALNTNIDKDVKKPSKEQILTDLKIDRAPSVSFSILSLIGFLGWIGSAIFFIVKIMGKEIFPGRAAFFTGLIFFIFYFMWIFGLARA